MIFGRLDTPSTYLPLTANPLWDLAFAALAQLDSHSEVGSIQLQGELMFLNVHTYKTRPVDLCRFEGHRDTIDIQYIISGGEVIEWALKQDLSEEGDYLAERDFQYYKRPTTPTQTRVHLTTGRFGIFFPDDAHRPQIHDGIHDSVFKAVVKIRRSLLA